MSLTKELTAAFKKNDTLLVLSALNKHFKNNIKDVFELEYYTGIDEKDWLYKLKTGLTIGEFMILINHFDIEAVCEHEGYPTEVPVLEHSYYRAEDYLSITTEFNVAFWIHLDITFKEIADFSHLSSSDVLPRFSALQRVIVGQDEQLKQLLLSIHTNLRIMEHNETAAIKIPKRNILIQGGTGTGKTFTIEKLGEYLKLPVKTFDASQLTQAGYVGADIDDVVHLLAPDMHRPQILFLDEFDKLCLIDNDKSSVSTYGGQKGILKLLEGKEIQSSVYNKNKSGLPDLDLSNVIIILGGSFSQFEDTRKMRPSKPMGFDNNTEGFNPGDTSISEKQLIEAGIIPEIAGRVGQVVVLNKLTESSLRTILVESKESILKQFKIIAKYDGKTFDLTEEQIKSIIKESEELKLGVRGLMTLTEKIYMKQMMTQLF